MLTWLAIQVFQILFSIHLTGDGRSLMLIFGFIEVFLEVAAVPILIGAAIYNRKEDK